MFALNKTFCVPQSKKTDCLLMSNNGWTGVRWEKPAARHSIVIQMNDIVAISEHNRADTEHGNSMVNSVEDGFQHILFVF